MADYNVNMKQWNGTSFDNVLPLAYNAKQLEGQSLAEVKQWVQDNGLLLYTGQYIGTGTAGSSSPTSVTFPFEPILFVIPQAYQEYGPMFTNIVNARALNTSFSPGNWLGEAQNDSMKISSDRKTFYWYASNSNPLQQRNYSGLTYYFAAIGGYDIGGPD